MRYIFLFLVCSQLAAQTDLHVPWVVNNETFSTIILVNNYGDSPAYINLTALRPDGRGALDEIRILPFQSSSVTPGSNFRRMGRGPGYTVRIQSDSDNITATAVISSRTTASNQSPSMVHALPAKKAERTLVFNFIPTQTGQISAPVTLNLGEGRANVTFTAMLDGFEVGQYQATIESGHVFAKSAAEMFPGLQGNLYVIVEGNQRLLGTSFIFNELREPSMALAQPIPVVTEP